MLAHPYSRNVQTIFHLPAACLAMDDFKAVLKNVVADYGKAVPEDEFARVAFRSVYSNLSIGHALDLQRTIPLQIMDKLEM